jgi:hypothetical protein
MNLDKIVKEKLKDYQIKPSAKSWERIEAYLDEDSKPKAWIFYIRWAAAASLLVAVGSYSFWKNSRSDREIVEVKQVVPQQVAGKNKEQTPDNQLFTPDFTHSNTENQLKNVVKNSVEHQNENRIEQANVIPQVVAESDKQAANQQQAQRTSKRPAEQYIALLQHDIPTLANQQNRNITTPSLPEFSSEATSAASSYIKWKKFFMEDASEKNDSTLTEKALTLANKKSVTFVKNNWKPAVAKWVKLKKGF